MGARVGKGGAREKCRSGRRRPSSSVLPLLLTCLNDFNLSSSNTSSSSLTTSSSISSGTYLGRGVRAIRDVNAVAAAQAASLDQLGCPAIPLAARFRLHRHLPSPSFVSSGFGFKFSLECRAPCRGAPGDNAPLVEQRFRV